MTYLAIRTDKPEAELYVYTEDREVARLLWLADRQLSVTLLSKIDEILQRQKLDLADISGIIVYEGPGSFTGLRIGITVANTLAYSRHIQVVGSSGDNWQQAGLEKMGNKTSLQIVTPQYGSDPHITAPRK